MKRIYLLFAAFMVAGASFAQTDSTKIDTTKGTVDTIKVGNFIIIKKGKGAPNEKNVVSITRAPKKPSRLSTNWWIFDIGFANLDDKTEYNSADALNYLRAPVGKPFTKDDLKLRPGKTSNVNVWVLMQRLKLAKGYVNLKYGIGFEMFNFRYENDISYHKSPSYIFRDSVQFSKNKLFASYLSVPLMINFNTSPGRKKGLSVSAGITGGYLVGSRNKQISDERGKDKTKGDLGLEQFRLAYTGELGIGPIRLFGSYSLTPLHDSGLKQYPYSLGIRLSNF